MSERPNPPASSGSQNRSTATAGDFQAVRAPLVVGISGHRDPVPEDKEKLEAAIVKILVELKSKYPSTPLVLLSPLAEGADQLAARAALCMAGGVRLVVPLPMPKEIYEADFGKEALKEFHGLLAQADEVVELPLVSGNTSEGIRAPGRQRDLQYESIGRYIAAKSQILIALWDGTDSGLVGGTSSVVRYQLEGVPPEEPCNLEAPEGFPVYHVPTRRMKNPQARVDQVNWQVLYPSAFGKNTENAEKYFGRMFSRIEGFNRHVEESGARLPEMVGTSKGYVLKDRSEETLPPGARAELDRYAFADILAVRFKRRRTATERAIHFLVFLSFLSFVFFAHLESHWVQLIYISFGLLLVAWIVRKRFGARDGETKAEDYRALAEALRVKFFWKLAGVQSEVADHYFGKQRTELDWIRHGVRGWNLETGPGGQQGPGTGSLEWLEFVKKHWFEDQLRYFTQAARRAENDHKNNHRWVNAGIGIALASGLGLVWVHCHEGLPHHQEWMEGLIILADLGLAAGALLHHYGDRMGYQVHAKEHARMEGVYEAATKLVGERLRDRDASGATGCIAKVGKEALRENGDWMMLRRERPLEIPHP